MYQIAPSHINLEYLALTISTLLEAAHKQSGLIYALASIAPFTSVLQIYNEFSRNEKGGREEFKKSKDSELLLGLEPPAAECICLSTPADVSCQWNGDICQDLLLIACLITSHFPLGAFNIYNS